MKGRCEVKLKLEGRSRAITPQLKKTIDYLCDQGCGYRLVAKMLNVQSHKFVTF